MLIEFSKAWGQDNYRWNYCGGDYNFQTMADFMEFYGIKKAWITGEESYFENEDSEKEIKCKIYSGQATKEIDRLKRHWVYTICKPCIYKIVTY